VISTEKWSHGRPRRPTGGLGQCIPTEGPRNPTRPLDYDQKMAVSGSGARSYSRRVILGIAILTFVGYCVVLGACIYLWDRPPVATFLITATAAPVGIIIGRVTRRHLMQARLNEDA